MFSTVELCEYLLSALNYLIKIIERMHRMTIEWSASTGCVTVGETYAFLQRKEEERMVIQK